jgi:hypothetical protein
VELKNVVVRSEGIGEEEGKSNDRMSGRKRILIQRNPHQLRTA